MRPGSEKGQNRHGYFSGDPAGSLSCPASGRPARDGGAARLGRREGDAGRVAGDVVFGAGTAAVYR